MLARAHEAVADCGAEREAGGEGYRLVVRPEAQVIVDAPRIDHLAGIHASLRIPQRLELAERLHQLRPEHHRQELAARLAVAVLARDRAAVLHHQRSRLAQELAPVRDAARRAQIEVDARVDATVAEVAVDRRAVAEALDQREELAQIIAEAHRIDRGVFPADDRIGPLAAEVERGGGCAGLANRPQAPHQRRIVDQ